MDSAQGAGRASPSGRGPSRRRVLGWLAVALVALGVLGVRRRAAIVRGFLAADAGGEPPGRMSDTARDALAASVAALLYERVEPEHYLELFRWRAEHLPGMRALYERFAARVERDAHRAGHRSFAAAPGEVRRRLLARYRPTRGRERLRRGFLARDDERFGRHVVRPVFRLFARTDAWILHGYPAWPGMPRAIATLAPKGGSA